MKTESFYKNLSTCLDDVVWKTEEDMQETKHVIPLELPPLGPTINQNVVLKTEQKAEKEERDPSNTNNPETCKL
ncbi:hypothetical protein RJ640_011699 [Escallonia rubra]|uniref:Uncharacterized protein n=1 Tax=Escallonia rubra TaxID=112253 RepID=A0AA88QRT1_9ASTE|nr:hypothetical protein RJ640_011699 [Escallonia rubra]